MIGDEQESERWRAEGDRAAALRLKRGFEIEALLQANGNSSSSICKYRVFHKAHLG